MRDGLQKRLSLTASLLWCLAGARGSFLALDVALPWFNAHSDPESSYRYAANCLVYYGSPLVFLLFFFVAIPVAIVGGLRLAKEHGLSENFWMVAAGAAGGVIINMIAGWVSVYVMASMSWAGRYEVMTEIFCWLALMAYPACAAGYVAIAREALGEMYEERIAYTPVVARPAPTVAPPPLPPAPPPIPLPVILN